MCSCCGSCDVATAMAPQHHPLAPLSALHLLRSYQHLLTQSPSLPHVPGEQSRPSFHQLGHSDIMIPSLETPRAPYCPPTFPLLPLVHDMKTTVAPKLLLPRENHWSPTGLLPSRQIASSKRPRGEKRPIPDEQKDEKYFERRKRNNQAAKKSRDARKIREDQIAFRAAVLEHENAMLRAQLITLREEAQSLRHLLMQQRKPLET